VASVRLGKPLARLIPTIDPSVLQFSRTHIRHKHGGVCFPPSKPSSISGTPFSRGSRDYGFVLSTSATRGFDPEASIRIQYEPRQVMLADGTSVELRQPRYRVDHLSGRELPSAAVLMRTTPLWGMNAAYASGQPLRLLHDGRARSIEEAILWHEAEARRARDNYADLSRQQRRALVEWIQGL
jgi:CxxC motif-containing protein (DUF1111 family)